MSISFNAPRDGAKPFWTFNIGHLLTIVTMFGWGITMALTVQSKLTEHDVKLAEAQTELTSLKTDLREISATLQRIAVDVAGIQGANRMRGYTVPAEKHSGPTQDGSNTTVRLPDPG